MAKAKPPVKLMDHSTLHILLNVCKMISDDPQRDVMAVMLQHTMNPVSDFSIHYPDNPLTQAMGLPYFNPNDPAMKSAGFRVETYRSMIAQFFLANVVAKHRDGGRELSLDECSEFAEPITWMALKGQLDEIAELFIGATIPWLKIPAPVINEPDAESLAPPDVLATMREEMEAMQDDDDDDEDDDEDEGSLEPEPGVYDLVKSLAHQMQNDPMLDQMREVYQIVLAAAIESATREDDEDEDNGPEIAEHLEPANCRIEAYHLMMESVLSVAFPYLQMGDDDKMLDGLRRTALLGSKEELDQWFATLEAGDIPEVPLITP